MAKDKSVISPEEVRHIAGLAHLGFSDSEIETLTGEMQSILGYIQKLTEAPTNDIEPLAHAAETSAPLRKDDSRPSLPCEEGLLNAPQKAGDFFLVPEVIANPKGKD